MDSRLEGDVYGDGHRYTPIPFTSLPSEPSSEERMGPRRGSHPVSRGTGLAHPVLSLPAILLTPLTPPKREKKTPRDTKHMKAAQAASNASSPDKFRCRSLPDRQGLRRDAIVSEADKEGDLYMVPPPTLYPPRRHCSMPTAPAQRGSSTWGVEGGRKMGNSQSPSQEFDPGTMASSLTSHDSSENQTRRSNLTALMDQQGTSNSIGASRAQPAPSGSPSPGKSMLRRQPMVFEADSASEPAVAVSASATNVLPLSTTSPASTVGFPPSLAAPASCPNSADIVRRSSWSENPQPANRRLNSAVHSKSAQAMRRCTSSKELGTFVPPSGSPYAFMLYQREVLEATMQQRLMAARESAIPSRSFTPSPSPVESSTQQGESQRKVTPSSRLTNEARNRRRAEHSRAVIRDLCEIVTDLFVAESKLLNPSSYGVQSALQREHVSRSVQQFLSDLPPRYALGVDTPSEVLLHMRLMAAARSNDSRAVVHIVNHESLPFSSEKTTAPAHTRPQTVIRLVTIACADARGLLEYITNLLSTGGSRVIDADVMLTSDNIALDRFVVEMNGRLRLDKLANGIEAFLKKAKQSEASESSTGGSDRSSLSKERTPGPLYFHPPSPDAKGTPREIHEEILEAVPLAEVLASNTSMKSLVVPMRGQRPRLIRQHSLPNPPPCSWSWNRTDSPHHESSTVPSAKKPPNTAANDAEAEESSTSHRRPLVNREATDFRGVGLEDSHAMDAVYPSFEGPEQRVVPLIPFEELMLIETLGMGRVSAIYRAAWQKQRASSEAMTNKDVKMVALKVASINPDTGDTSHVDELRREADIAAMLGHTNVCELVGVAADSECFCLAYDFCDGGSLFSLLVDSSRHYEYLPIALDIANGMAYLHHRNVIHRDLKPSNVLLTRDHRAKIADFGMSVANTGQELTAETGTYRYMAPEVIRHESYSSNADVYSFGIVLWQLITREVPFATMTPIQAAWAVAEGRRPEIPPETPHRLKEIMRACWDQDSHKRPSFTYIAMALADYAKMAFSPGHVGAQTLMIANEMLANVQGNSTVNVDFSTPVAVAGQNQRVEQFQRNSWFSGSVGSYSSSTNVGLEI